MPFDTPDNDFTDEQLEAELAATEMRMADGSMEEGGEGGAGGGEDGGKPGLKERWQSLPPAKETSWKDVWQLPTLLASAGLLGVVAWMVKPEQVADDFEGALENVEKLVEAHRFDEAKTELNEIGTQINRASDDLQGWFKEIDADRLYLTLEDRNVGETINDIGKTNRRQILAQYKEAQDLYEMATDGESDWPEDERKPALDDQSLHFKARMLVDLGERKKALAMLEDMADSAPRRRYDLIRSLIEQERRQPDGGNQQEVLRLLENFRTVLADETDRERKIDQSIWAYRLEAKLRVASKDYDGALDGLIRRVQRLRSLDATPEQVAPLLVDMGRIYLTKGQYELAEQTLESARNRLPSNHGLNAEILVSLADIALSKPGGGVDEAQGLYRRVVDSFKGEKAYVDGLVGMADTQARSPDDPKQWSESIKNFARAIEWFDEHPSLWGAPQQNAAERIQTHAAFLMAANDHDRALSYLELLGKLHGPDESPAQLKLDKAITHQAMADALREEAEALNPKKPGTGLTPSDVVDIQGQKRREAAVHYEDAAEQYRSYAHQVTVSDDAGHGNGLWQAAQCYDLAQMPEKAIETYVEFVTTRESDTRVAEAKNRLGRAFMALGDEPAAVDQFKDLQTEFPNSSWAVDALIPQASAYVRMNQLDQAERLLKSVLTEHPSIEPESDEYREALMALGTLYYSRGEETPGDFEEAINYLTQAVTRYGNSKEGPRLRFILADSYRKSVPQLQLAMGDRQSQADRLAFQNQVKQRLETSAGLFRDVRHELEDLPPEARSDKQDMYLRNAYFYEADAIYDLGDYEQALGLYANAASRFQHHPAALAAMVQMVNAHCELGQYEQARVANKNAEAMLSRLSETAMADGAMPLSREQWERWLSWSGKLEVLSSAPQE